MAKAKVVRVSTGPLERARELLPSMDKVRFGPGESPAMSDRQLVDTGMGWFIGRLEGDVFTRKELDDTALRTVVDVLGQTLGVTVNGMSVDGKLTLTWDAQGQHSEITVNMEA